MAEHVNGGPGQHPDRRSETPDPATVPTSVLNPMRSGRQERDAPPWPRVRLLRRVVIHVGSSGVLDAEQVRRAVHFVAPADDVVLIVRGRLGFEPGVAAYLGCVLAGCRTVQVEANGPGAASFAADLARAARAEAMAG